MSIAVQPIYEHGRCPTGCSAGWCACVVTKGIAIQTLSPEERQTLIAIIDAVHGAGLSCDEFADAVLGLFEDIPGFETMPSAKAIRIVRQLWSTYHGQEISQV